MNIIMTGSNRMGNQREYIKSEGFLQYLYEDHPNFRPVTINGIRGKVLHFIADGIKDHTGLPQYAHTSDMYFRVGKDGSVIQGKVYVDHKHVMDFDWSHRHVNPDGSAFVRGVVHVQVYEVDSKGVSHRLSDNARYMSNAEITKYGSIIKAFNHDVKFRP